MCRGPEKGIAVPEETDLHTLYRAGCSSGLDRDALERSMGQRLDFLDQLFGTCDGIGAEEIEVDRLAMAEVERDSGSSRQIEAALLGPGSDHVPELALFRSEDMGMKLLRQRLSQRLGGLCAAQASNSSREIHWLTAS